MIMKYELIYVKNYFPKLHANSPLGSFSFGQKHVRVGRKKKHVHESGRLRFDSIDSVENCVTSVCRVVCTVYKGYIIKRLHL